MKERLLSIVGALIMVMPMMAQDANALQNVSVGELNYTVKEQDKTAVETVVGAVLDVLAEQTTTEQPGYADAVRASVVAALGNVRRFVVTDMREVAPTDATNIILDGTVNYISTTRELRTNSDKKKVPEFYAQINVTLNLKDAQTGTVINGHTFDVNRTSWSWFNSVDTAIKDALEGLRSKVTRFYNSAYPYTAHILERGTEKKDKQKELYIDLGAQHGLREGTHFDVYIIGSIGGKETRKQIGRLRVKDIEGDEVSLCKVTSGGKDIKAALDAEKQLLIISTD
ncbi:MAG: hypothetical protein IJQ49_04020 [Prevotella sp.]|jgi:flagellar basal body-associated protein FliL|nr:hypothetical protein [Prevotella sp.]